MTKTAEKPYPLGPHIPIQPILGSIPPGIAVNQHSVCTSVTDNCHTNSFLVCYVTRDNKGGQTFTDIRIDDVRNTRSSRITVIDCSAGFGQKKVYTIIFTLYFLWSAEQEIKNKTSQNSPWFKFIFLLPGNCKDYDNLHMITSDYRRVHNLQSSISF